MNKALQVSPWLYVMEKTGRKEQEASKMCPPLMSTKRKKDLVPSPLLHTAQKKIIYCKSVWLDVLDPNKNIKLLANCCSKNEQETESRIQKGSKSLPYSLGTGETAAKQSRKCKYHHAHARVGWFRWAVPELCI